MTNSRQLTMLITITTITTIISRVSLTSAFTYSELRCTPKTVTKDCKAALGEHFYCNAVHRCDCKIFYERSGKNGTCKSIGPCSSDQDCLPSGVSSDRRKDVACYDDRCSCRSTGLRSDNDEVEDCMMSPLFGAIIILVTTLLFSGCIIALVVCFVKSGKEVLPKQEAAVSEDSLGGKAASAVV